jgi:hypothetical protein
MYKTIEKVFVFTPVFTRCRWEDEIKMDLREIGWGGVHWIHLTQDRELL